MSLEKINKSVDPYEGVDMQEWTNDSVQIANNEISAISQQQNPTGRNDGEFDYFSNLLNEMRNKKITPNDAILEARSYADSRQDGHGGGVIQD